MDKQLMKQRINEVIKTDATVVELQDFMATHVPFKRLKYYTSGIEAIKGKELSEEQFFYEFIEDTKDKHNFIVVQGDNGSGKSHFIRWIKNKIESEETFPNDVIILLERSQNTLQATIKQLAKNKIIENLLSEEEKLKLKNTSIELSEEKFTALINYNFIIEAENEEDDDEECVLRAVQRKGLAELLKDEIIQKNILFKENGPIKRISNKLINSEDNSINETDIRFKEEDFALNSGILNELKESDSNKKALRFAENLKEDKRGIRDKVVTYLNSKMDIVIQRTIKLNATDLNSILETIRIKLKKMNKNLILFIEDITAFTGIDKGVIESLIVEHREDNGLCRIFSVVGVTTGYYQSHFPDNLKDRVTARIFIDRDSLLNEETDVLELAVRYINAINNDKDELKKWIMSGAEDSKLPIKKSNKSWDIYIDEQNREFSLYPLTSQAIINLYNEIKDKKTPRVFIKNILLPILLHYVNDDNFPEGLSEFESQIIIPKLKNELLNKRIDDEIKDQYENSRTKCLLRIWGDGTIDYSTKGNINYIGNIDERIFDEFKVIKVKGNKIFDRNENIKETKKTTTSSENTHTAITNKKNSDNKQKEYNLIEKDLKEWFFKGDRLKINKKIRDNIVSFIKESIDWNLEDVSMYLVDGAISINNIKIEEALSSEEKNNDIIYIERTEENYYFLLSLMKYTLIGNKTWNYENAQDDILVTTKWIENNKRKIVNYVLNGNDINYSMYDYAICAEFYSMFINEKNLTMNKSISELSIKKLYDFVINKLEIKSKEELEDILGEFAITYYDKREIIKVNDQFIKEFYNCPLGKGNGVFLDACEILNSIKNVVNFNFDINKFENLSFNSKKDLWKRPYDLLKKFYGLNLQTALLKKIKPVQEKNNKEYLQDFKDIGIINSLFETFDKKKIYYDNNLKRDFEKFFDDTTKYNNYLKNKKEIEDFNNKDLFGKIYLLKTNIPKKVLEMNNVLEKIENIISIQEKEYKNKSNLDIVSKEDVDSVVNECLSKIDKMTKNLKELKEVLKENVSKKDTSTY